MPEINYTAADAAQHVHSRAELTRFWMAETGATESEITEALLEDTKEADMTTKSTPKSCSCIQCSRARATKSGKAEMLGNERTFRHASNQAVRQGQGDDVLAAGVSAPIG